MCVCIHNEVNLKQPYVSGCLTLSDTLSFPTENSPRSLRTRRVFQCWSVTCLHSSCASRLASSYPPFFFSSLPPLVLLSPSNYFPPKLMEHQHCIWFHIMQHVRHWWYKSQAFPSSSSMYSAFHTCCYKVQAYKIHHPDVSCVRTGCRNAWHIRGTWFSFVEEIKLMS